MTRRPRKDCDSSQGRHSSTVECGHKNNSRPARIRKQATCACQNVDPSVGEQGERDVSNPGVADSSQLNGAEVPKRNKATQQHSQKDNIRSSTWTIFLTLLGSMSLDSMRFSTARTTPSAVWMPRAVEPSCGQQRRRRGKEQGFQSA